MPVLSTFMRVILEGTRNCRIVGSSMVLLSGLTAPGIPAAGAPELVVGDSRTGTYHLSHCSGFGSVPTDTRVLFVGEDTAISSGYALDPGCSDAPREQARRDEARAEQLRSNYRRFLRSAFLSPATASDGPETRLEESDCRTVPVRVNHPSLTEAGKFCARMPYAPVSLDLHVELTERAVLEVVVVAPPGVGDQVFVPFAGERLLDFARTLESARGVGNATDWTMPEPVGEGLAMRYRSRDRLGRPLAGFVHVSHWDYEGGGFRWRGIITYRRLGDAGMSLHEVDEVVDAVEYAKGDVWQFTW